MALEEIVNQMTGLQMAEVIKNNFEKVLDVSSAENMAENAGKSLKTDYDATRYLPLELADGTPVRMRWDVFLQAQARALGQLMYGAEDASSLATVVAGMFAKGYSYNLNTAIGFYECGMILNTSSNSPFPGNHGLYFTMRAKYSDDNDYVIQFAVEAYGGTNRIYYRTCWANKWADWIQLS